MGEFISSIKNIIKIHLLPYSPRRITRQNWDLQFKHGHWDFLWSNDELIRYNYIYNLLSEYLRQDFKILDLGCGEGNLYKHIQSLDLTDYVGVDISEEAITKAKRLFNGNGKFICEDLCKYNPEDSYDFIIFNESLYYLDKPIAVINRYKKFLKKEGKIIVSMWYDKVKNNKLWKRIDSNFKIESQKTINNNKGISWIIKVLK